VILQRADSAKRVSTGATQLLLNDALRPETIAAAILPSIASYPGREKGS
jgi:hypothetical protein